VGEKSNWSKYQYHEHEDNTLKEEKLKIKKHQKRETIKVGQFENGEAS
jgi:hypothetical protein